MSLEKSTEPRKIIVAYRLRVILKNGFYILYTHVTEFGNRKEGDEYLFIVNGETTDSFDMPYQTFDKHRIQDMLHMTVEQFGDIKAQL